MTSVTVEEGDEKGQIPIIKPRRRRCSTGTKERETEKRKEKKRFIPLLSETPVDPGHNLMKPV